MSELIRLILFSILVAISLLITSSIVLLGIVVSIAVSTPVLAIWLIVTIISSMFYAVYKFVTAVKQRYFERRV